MYIETCSAPLNSPLVWRIRFTLFFHLQLDSESAVMFLNNPPVICPQSNLLSDALNILRGDDVVSLKAAGKVR